MNESLNESVDFNRRDFLKSGSMATVMAMLGGVPLVAQNAPAPGGDAKPGAPRTKVGLIGLGPWGREILNTLARLETAEIAAVCDNYPAFLKRGATAAPGAMAVDDYTKILENKDIKAVIVATATHQHKDIVLAALKAGKHVYCEAPLAHTLEDVRAIVAAAKAAPHLVFQAGLQMRADPQRHFLLPFIRSGAIGQPVMARAQWHKKQSWRATSPNPEREKAVNWRLDRALSLGLTGELGVHPIDQATWFLNARPVAVTGYGTIAFWKDGRDTPDTEQVIFEFPGGLNLVYNATLANSFDADYEILYGSDAAVMMRESKAWMFKEVDSPLLGWEVYARKETFYKETGIMLVADASKKPPSEQPQPEVPYTNTPLSYSLANFLRSASDLSAAADDFISSFGSDDADALRDHLRQVPRQRGATFLEGYVATMLVIKAREAVLKRGRVEIPSELYELT